jgi:hypothetical protein
VRSVSDVICLTAGSLVLDLGTTYVIPTAYSFFGPIVILFPVVSFPDTLVLRA